MTNDQLRGVIAGGEGPAMEFKQSLTRDLGRELCAFANAAGGTVLLGVSDAGEIMGVRDHNVLKSRIQSTARSADPPITVNVDSVGQVLRVVVPRQHRKPYSFGGRFFMREGASSQRMSRSEIEDMFYAAGHLHFDRALCPNYDIDRDIDDERWREFSDRARIPRSMDRTVALRNLGLVDAEYRMRHAGAWLLARDIRTVTISAHVSCAMFLGTTKVSILDRRDFSSDIVSMVDEAVTWILGKIDVGLVIRGIRHEERPELPPGALREAVANALVHRDYRSTGNVHVYVFKDKVEIVSPGGLPTGMNEADLGTRSVPRNPLLFAMLHRMGVVEHIGSGVRRIRDLCDKHEMPEPEFAVSDHWVSVCFARAGGTRGPESTAGGPESGPESTAGGPESGPESTAGGPESGPESTVRGPESQGIDAGALDVRVLSSLATGPLSKSAIADALGHRSVSSALNRTVRGLLRDSLVEYTLPDKPSSRMQRYRLTPAGQLAVREKRH